MNRGASEDTFLEFYRNLLWLGGAAVLAAVLLLDPRWLEARIATGVLLAAVVLLRWAPVRLSKYSYLTQHGIAALVGTLVSPPGTVAVALALGVMIVDIGWLRKSLRAGAINAGREVLAFSAAYGFYAATIRLTGASSLSLDFLPAAFVLAGSYFFFTRTLFYLSLLVRGKLELEERLFILRWEIVSYLLTVLAAALAAWAIATLSPTGWLAVALALGVLGLLTRTLIEEAIAAEDLNKVHLMQGAVTSNVSLQASFEQIERLAYRLLDWGDLRIYRSIGTAPELAYRGTFGRPGRGVPAPELEEYRRQVVRRGEPMIIHDTRRDPYLSGRNADIASVVLYPLRFAEETIGTLELEHHKRHIYGTRDMAAVTALAAQVSTAIHIAELRRPLIQTVDQIGVQVQALARASDSLRTSAAALESASDNMRRRVAAQDDFARAGLGTTTALSSLSEHTAQGGARAARASEHAALAAAQNRRAIGEAIQRLVQVQGFVAESSRQVTALGAATERITGFLGSIREIAELTNLIALNASIEAARAGAEGRGFAVVAEEIRQLAVQSAQAAREAGRLVSDVTAEVGGIVAQMHRGQAVVAGVGEMSEEAARALDAIVTATQEAGEQARDIADAAAEQEEASRHLASQIAQVAAASERTRGDTEALADQATRATRGQADLDRAIDELEQVASNLQALARYFAVES